MAVRTVRGAVPTDAGAVRRIIVAINNSSAFYFGSLNNDWTLPQNDALWKDDVKNLFDPCPSGWRVPKGGTQESNANIWNSFTSDNTTWTGTDAASGRYFEESEVHGGRAWYAAGGYRRFGAQGLLAHVQTQCYLCSSSSSGTYSYFMSFWPGGVSPFGNDHYRTSAMPVRCVRE